MTDPRTHHRLQQMLRRGGVLLALGWLVAVALTGLTAPFLASGHPLWMGELAPDGKVVRVEYPLWNHLDPIDLLLPAAVVLAGFWWGLVARAGRDRTGRAASDRHRAFRVRLERADFWGGILTAVITLVVAYLLARWVLSAAASRDAPAWVAAWRTSPWFGWQSSAAAALTGLLLGCAVPLLAWRLRLAVAGSAAVTAALCVGLAWSEPLERFDEREREALGQVRCVWTVVPRSPMQGELGVFDQPPGTSYARPVVA